MGTAKHTPGPWMLGEKTPSKYDQPIYANGAEGCVGICVVDLYGADEADANARLIAAAPDLLEACKALLFAIKECEDAGCIDHLDCWDGVEEKWDAPKSNAFAAIAKAEGGASCG